MSTGLNMKLSNMEKMTQWGLHPVPTIYPKGSGKESLLRTPTIPRRSPIKRNIHKDEITVFKPKDKATGFYFLDNLHAPLHGSFKRLSKSI